MKTKVVKLRTGNRVVLYFSEDQKKWVSDKDIASDNWHKYILKGESKQSRTIANYYRECSIDYTRSKIKTMVNESMDNIPRVYDLVIAALVNRREI